MATLDPTIHRDAEGRVVLTPEQAEALARWWVDDDDDSVAPVLAAEIQRDWEGVVVADALARYVLATAPIVRAAVAQEAAVRSHFSGGDTSWLMVGDARADTEAAVRAWREAGGGE